MATKTLEVSGSVVDQNGNPIEGASVQLDDLNSQSSAWTQTGNNGNYHFTFGLVEINDEVSPQVTATKIGFKGTSRQTKTKKSSISMKFQLTEF